MFQDVLNPFHLQPLKQILRMYNVYKMYILEKNLCNYDEKKRFFIKKWGKVSIYF